ncbi:MAG TPA: flagellar basal body L-ring protein FlgH [Pirellulaceae bacterium]|nr:flagellar basal body L-ring protein FlgH [Pirellulaceae bacterium]
MTMPSKWCLVLMWVAGMGTCASTFAQTSSLWSRRDPAFVNPYADVKARRPGDLLVIRINERSDVDNRDQRLMQKQSKSSSDASVSAGFNGFIGNSNGALNLDQETGASRNFNGNSQFRSERAFIDQFTVTVIDITPNGNLLVSGTRHVALEGDERTLVLTGVVRASDILPDNSISSARVADLDIRYESTGPQGAEQKFINQGWMGKVFNRVWPH